MKKVFIFLVTLVILLTSVGFKDFSKNENEVIIYSSMINVSNVAMAKMFKEELPNVKVNIQYIPSGNNAAKLKVEGILSQADIVMGIEYGYLNSLSGCFEKLEPEISNIFLDELIAKTKNYIPDSKYGIAIIVNMDVLKKYKLPEPKCYKDLTKSFYRNQITMPSPVASGTAYGFVKGMVNLMGEKNAFTYFDELNKNIKHYTSSGSGPVNNLVRGECAIGIGMVFQAVQEINKGANLKILSFKNIGIPYNVSGSAIIKGKSANKNVKDVFNIIAKKYLRYDKKYILPDQIYKEQDLTTIENYPIINNYIDMKGLSDEYEKKRILKKWKY